MPAPSTLRDRLEESYRLLSVTRPSAEWLLRQAFFRTAGRVQKTLYKRVARSMTHQVAKRQPSANGQPDLPPASDERWCKVSALAFAEAIRVSRLTVIPAGDTSAKTGWHSLYQDVGATVAVTSDWSELATTVQQQPRDVHYIGYDTEGNPAILAQVALFLRDGTLKVWVGPVETLQPSGALAGLVHNHEYLFVFDGDQDVASLGEEGTWRPWDVQAHHARGPQGQKQSLEGVWAATVGGALGIRATKDARC